MNSAIDCKNRPVIFFQPGSLVHRPTAFSPGCVVLMIFRRFYIPLGSLFKKQQLYRLGLRFSELSLHLFP